MASLSAAVWRSRWRRLPVTVRAWLVSRILVVGLAVLFGLSFGLVVRGADPGVPDLFVLTRAIDPWVPHSLVLLGDWDTTWYLDIARHGYAHDIGQVGVRDTNLAFFPLVPGIMAAFAALGINPFLAMLVVANGAFLGFLVGVRALTARLFAGRVSPERAVWAAALLPPAAYASLAYTEALVMACAVGAALLMLNDRPAAAGALAAVAALSRPPGLIVAGLVVLLALTGPPGRRVRGVVWALVPCALALAGFFAWMWWARGAPALPLEAQASWGRGQAVIGVFTAFPSELAAAVDQVVHLRAGAAWTAAVRDVGFTALYVLLLVGLWRMCGGLRSPWVAYSVAALALPLSTGSFMSMARFGTLAFPLMWPLAVWLDGAPRRRRWAAGAAVLVTALLVAQLRIRSP